MRRYNTDRQVRYAVQLIKLIALGGAMADYWAGSIGMSVQKSDIFAE